MRVGRPRSTCTTQASWTLLSAPIAIGSMSPRTVALNHTEALRPTLTSPTRAAPGATNAVGSMLSRVGR